MENKLGSVLEAALPGTNAVPLAHHTRTARSWREHHSLRRQADELVNAEAGVQEDGHNRADQGAGALPARTRRRRSTVENPLGERGCCAVGFTIAVGPAGMR